MQFSIAEMVSIRDFRRESAERIRQLEEYEIEKLALTRHGKVVAILVSPEVYEGMGPHEWPDE